MKNLILLTVLLLSLNVCAQETEARLNLDDWKKDHREAVETMIQKYGQPDGSTGDMVVWNNKGPWKKIIIYKDEWDHKFPKGHTDYVEQFINYKAPVDKFDDIAKYDGSIILERTAGLISARCDKEEMNFLAINLAHEVATGKRTVKDAREFYAKTAFEFMAGKKSSPYTTKLLFDVPNDYSSGIDPLIQQADPL